MSKIQQITKELNRIGLTPTSTEHCEFGESDDAVNVGNFEIQICTAANYGKNFYSISEELNTDGDISFNFYSKEHTSIKSVVAELKKLIEAKA